MTKRIEVEEPTPEEPEQKVKFKITQKKKSVAEMTPEEVVEETEPEKIQVKLKKVKKRKVSKGKEVEELVPTEEVTEFPELPEEVIEFIDIQETMDSTEVTTEGVNNYLPFEMESWVPATFKSQELFTFTFTYPHSFPFDYELVNPI